MSQEEKVIGGMHSPKDVVFVYKNKGRIPSFASYEDGRPYSGKASGTMGIADWWGPYREGLPDGEFNVVLGDRGRFKYEYIRGKYVEKNA